MDDDKADKKQFEAFEVLIYLEKDVKVQLERQSYSHPCTAKSGK